MTEKKKTDRTYQAETFGLPPLKMVLVHAQNDRANAAIKHPLVKSKSKLALSEHEAVMKIIEHLMKGSE
jgi:hypothetical protein